MLKKLPIGIDDFEELILQDYYFVDKSLFIKELLESGEKATLIPRPRRFGKTLNLSMLRYFFEKTENSRACLFDKLAIAKYKEIMVHQGQYPVIFLTLKSIDSKTWDICFEKLKGIISDIYRCHNYLLKDSFLDVSQKEQFEAVIALKADQALYELSLKKLIEYLNVYHQKRPIVLIDEYDVPVHAGYKYGYYDDVVPFIRAFFGDAVKGNNHLQFAVITGALRIAKESVFTGMNNPLVCTMLTNLYADKFGLLAHEVKDLLSYYGLENNEDEVRSWYNGYTSGSYTVYNPWSIINLAKHNGDLQPYWVNTSDNDIVKTLIKNSSYRVKEDIEILISHTSITKDVREDIAYPELANSDTVLWNFLLFTGYLTFKNKRSCPTGEVLADFLIPNIEVTRFFKATILSWFEPKNTGVFYDQAIQALINGDIASFEEQFSSFVHTSFSFFDITGDYPENFYHAFILGMLVSLSNRYEIKSNRESGIGRYDIMLIPHERSSLGIVMEFKKVSVFRKETIEKALEDALKQIKEKHYATEIFSRGIKAVVGIGIAFHGKQVFMQSENLTQ